MYALFTLHKSDLQNIFIAISVMMEYVFCLHNLLYFIVFTRRGY